MSENIFQNRSTHVFATKKMDPQLVTPNLSGGCMIAVGRAVRARECAGTVCWDESGENCGETVTAIFLLL